MQTYANIDDLWHDTLNTLVTRGTLQNSRNGDSFEITGFQAKLLYPDRNFVRNTVRKLSPTYAAAELLWYLSRQSSIEMIKHYAPSYINFADVDGTAFGAYGARLECAEGYPSQIHAVIDLLKHKPDSRQAVCNMWQSPGDLAAAIVGNHKDIPCTLSWQFLLRDKRLHMICTMRSNDVWLGLPYDIFVNTTIQRLIADELRVHVGTYTHNAGSMHLYETNFYKALDALHADLAVAPVGNCWDGPHPFLNHIEMAVTAEHVFRTNTGKWATLAKPLPPILRDMVCLCASTTYDVPIHSIVLREIVQWRHGHQIGAHGKPNLPILIFTE